RVALEQHDPDLGRPVAHPGRQTRGLEVDDGDGSHRGLSLGEGGGQGRLSRSLGLGCAAGSLACAASSLLPVATSSSRRNSQPGNSAITTSAVVRTTQPGITCPPFTPPWASATLACRCAPSTLSVPESISSSSGPLTSLAPALSA